MLPRLVPAELSALADVHCFGARDLRRLARRASGGVRPQPALEALLTRIACCVRVEPSLLRALRRLSPDTADEPGLEGLLWGHEPVVLAGYQCCELAPAQLPVPTEPALPPSTRRPRPRFCACRPKSTPIVVAPPR